MKALELAEDSRKSSVVAKIPLMAQPPLLILIFQRIKVFKLPMLLVGVKEKSSLIEYAYQGDQTVLRMKLP